MVDLYSVFDGHLGLRDSWLRIGLTLYIVRLVVLFFAACVSTWTVNNNIYTVGMYSVGAMTLSQCKDRCVTNPNCLAIGHNYKDSTCWIGEITSNLVTQYRWTDGNQYVLVSRCDTPPTNRELTIFFLKICMPYLWQCYKMFEINESWFEKKQWYSM